jgi:LysM repeat protein
MQRRFRIGLLIVLKVLILKVIIALLVLSPHAALFARPVFQTGDPVIVAAGDISICSNKEDEETARLLDQIEGTVLPLGDNAYELGSSNDFQFCYGPTWGRHKARTRPVPGNHEYGVEGAMGYFGYFGDAATPLEPGCTRHCKGYYSYDLGAWHLIALNSESGNGVGSEQEQWLRADLAAHPTHCTLAYWHRPRYSSGYHGSGSMFAIFQALYDFGADIVLVGHDHDYERFAPQGPDSALAPTRGIRQFVVGTGGAPLRGFQTVQPNSEVRDSATFGVLKMTLHPTSYDWEFIPINGQTFRDAGSGECVTAGNLPAPLAAVATATVVTTTTPLPAATPVATAVTVPPAGLDYTIQAGDTLGTIAARYGLTWQQIATANGLDAYSILEIGQVIRLPGVQGTGSTTAVTSTVSTVASSAPSVTSSSVVTGAQTTASTGTTSGAGRYVVQPGDTLWSIAVRHNLTWQALAAANGMGESDILVIGRELILPGQAAVTPPVAAATP